MNAMNGKHYLKFSSNVTHSLAAILEVHSCISKVKLKFLFS